MLSDERVREAEKNFRSYLEEGLVRKAKPDERILKTYVKNSDESLKAAVELQNSAISNLWVIVCSYYAMFYIANAALYKEGYKVGEKIAHKVTSDALTAALRNKIKASLLKEFAEAQQDALELAETKTEQLIESFDNERKKRSRFQYEMPEEIKASLAQTSLKRAKAFALEIKKLLG